MVVGMGVIEEVGASARTLLARFTQGLKAGQRVVGAPWPTVEGEGLSQHSSLSLNVDPYAESQRVLGTPWLSELFQHVLPTKAPTGAGSGPIKVLTEQ